MHYADCLAVDTGHDLQVNATRYAYQAPYPTAWDFVFDQTGEGFVLVHLKDGDVLGGYWGRQSYAGSVPNDGDIYIEAVYDVGESGVFGRRIPNTRGVLLRKEQYSYIELFSVPQVEGS